MHSGKIFLPVPPVSYTHIDVYKRQDLDLERMECFTDQLTLTEKWECVFLIPMEVKLQSVETVSVLLQNILWTMSMLQRKKLPVRLYQ